MTKTNSTLKFVKLGMTALKNNFMGLSNPYKLTYSISYWCNSKCLTCNIWQMKPAGELTLDEIKEFAKANPYFKWIEITGGEPFMRSDVAEIAKTFAQNCKDLYIITIPTNSLTNHDMVIRKINEILDTGVPRLSVTVSLDGDKELHDKIRGVPGNYERCIDMWKKLQELRKTRKNLFCVFGYTISKFNQGQFEKVYQNVKKDVPDLRYNNFHLNVGQVSDIYYSNKEMEITPQKDIVASDIKWMIDHRESEAGAIPIIETAYLKKLLQYVTTGKVPMKSKSMDASLFMDSYGNVYPSIMWGRKIGNIRDTKYDLKSIWRGEEANEVRKLIKEGKEPDCWTACEAYQTLVGNVTSLI